MANLSLSSGPGRGPRFPLFTLGFRPFFLGASAFAAGTVALWAAVYVFQFALPFETLSPSQWHAHEMIYGYSVAVIAGFLLTAVRNWTGIPTPSGAPLAVLFSLWAAARVLFLFGTAFIPAAAAFDLVFILLLVAAVLRPIVKTRQWKQIGVAAKLVLLAAGHAVFYLGVAGAVSRGIHWGLYGGLYLVVGLILTIGGRVIPGFIRNGVGYEVALANPRWIGLVTLSLYLVFFVSEVFLFRDGLTAGACAGLFIVTTKRLAGWHTSGIWRKPLLWSLFLAIAFIDAGFLLFALRPLVGLSMFVPVHAMAFGGIGLITIGMMARVALGHSGRSIHRPPGSIFYAAAALAVGGVIRIAGPALDPARYAGWIGASQACWVFAFALFVFSYAPILVGPDADPESAG